MSIEEPKHDYAHKVEHKAHKSSSNCGFWTPKTILLKLLNIGVGGSDKSKGQRPPFKKSDMIFTPNFTSLYYNFIEFR